MTSVAFLIPYFGRWPDWFDYFLLSVGANPTIDWLFFCDHPAPAHAPINARFHLITFEEYWRWAGEKLGISHSQTDVYKLCDLKPFYGFLHEKDVQGYDYFGISDIDVIYGNLRAFLTESILQRQVISAMGTRVCGHFTLFQNSARNREAAFRIPRWRERLNVAQHTRMTEGDFSRVYYAHRRWPKPLRWVLNRLNPLQRNNHFRNQYTTPFCPEPWEDGSWRHPTEWFWKNGRLGNDLDQRRDRLYLHFMNWKGARYLHPMWGKQAAWTGKNIRRVSLEQARRGFRITPDGFFPLGEHIHSLRQAA